MFRFIEKIQQNNEYSRKLENLRGEISAFHDLLAAEDVTFKVRMGSRIRRYLEKSGSDGRLKIDDDEDLDIQNQIIDNLRKEEIYDIYRKLTDERFEGYESEDESNYDYAKDSYFWLVSKWYFCKYITKSASSKKIFNEAKALEDILYFHIKSLMNVVRGKLM